MAKGSFIRGVICTLAGAVLWGFSGACIQQLTSTYNAQPLFITLMRMLGAGVLICAWLLVRQRQVLSRMFGDRRALARLALFGCAGLFMCQVTYVIVIQFTNGGTATALQGLNVAFIVVATSIMRRRAPSRFEVAGMCTAFVATVLIATKGDLGVLVIPLAGLVWGIISAGSVAFYTMYPRRLFAQFGSLPVTGVGMLFGGVLALVLFLCQGLWGAAPQVPALDAYGVAVLAGTVLLGSAGAFGLFLHGVSIVGSVKGSQLGAIEPVSATLFSWLWLGTAFTWADWVGLALMVTTVFLVSLQRHSEKAKEAQPAA